MFRVTVPLGSLASRLKLCAGKQFLHDGLVVEYWIFEQEVLGSVLPLQCNVLEKGTLKLFIVLDSTGTG